MTFEINEVAELYRLPLPFMFPLGSFTLSFRDYFPGKKEMSVKSFINEMYGFTSKRYHSESA